MQIFEDSSSGWSASLCFVRSIRVINRWDLIGRAGLWLDHRATDYQFCKPGISVRRPEHDHLSITTPVGNVGNLGRTGWTAGPQSIDNGVVLSTGNAVDTANPASSNNIPSTSFGGAARRRSTITPEDTLRIGLLRTTPRNWRSISHCLSPARLLLTLSLVPSNTHNTWRATPCIPWISLRRRNCKPS